MSTTNVFLIADNAGQGVPAQAANIGYIVIDKLYFPEKFFLGYHPHLIFKKTLQHTYFRLDHSNNKSVLLDTDPV